MIAIDEASGMAEVEYRIPRECVVFLPRLPVILKRTCVCGAWISDGPFRFCTVCRQVDLSSTMHGGA